MAEKMTKSEKLAQLKKMIPDCDYCPVAYVTCNRDFETMIPDDCIRLRDNEIKRIENMETMAYKMTCERAIEIAIKALIELGAKREYLIENAPNYYRQAADVLRNGTETVDRVKRAIVFYCNECDTYPEFLSSSPSGLVCCNCREPNDAADVKALKFYTEHQRIKIETVCSDPVFEKITDE